MHRRSPLSIQWVLATVISTLFASMAVIGRSAAASVLPAGLAVANFSAWHGHGNLAFVSRGRLLVIDGADDAVRVVAPSVATGTPPQFSPDGRWLLYGTGGSAWLARSSGTDPRKLPGGPAAWLPDGRLWLGSSIYDVENDEQLVRVHSAPSDLVGSSRGGNEYVFQSDTLKIDYPYASTGVERVETSTSLNGKRTLWFEDHLSFTKRLGVHGDFLTVVAVLPHDTGLLVLDDVDQSDEADGRRLDVIRRPGGPLVQLTTVLATSAGGTVTQSLTDELAIGAGGDRYAWAPKDVEVCAPTAMACTLLQVPSGTSTLDPAWSPTGSELAVVESHNEPEGTIGQSVVAGWYQTHRLALLKTNTRRPTTIRGTTGAATPMWSKDGTSLLYVADDGLWLVPADSSRPPTEIVAPLFPPGAWPSYYGEVDWIDQFSWNEGVSSLGRP